MNVKIERTETEYAITYRVLILLDGEWQPVNVQRGTALDDEAMRLEAIEIKRQLECDGA